MNKTLLIALSVIVMVGAGAFFLFSKDNASSLQTNATTSTTSSTSLPAGNQKGLICEDITMEGDAGTSKTTLYILKDAVRYDTILDHEDGGQKELHAISTQEKTYIWGNALEIMPGQQMALVFDNEEEEVSLPLSLQEMREMKKNPEYLEKWNCREWEGDATLFTPPADISFQTQDSLMKNMLQGMQGLKEAVNSSAAEAPTHIPTGALPCDMCESIPDAKAKAACQASCE